MALTKKQRVFVDEYLQCWNATEAAKRAGYSERTAYSIGARLLKNVEIVEDVQARLAERQMSADEALTILADMARGDVGDAVTDDGIIDMAALKKAGKTHLVKSYSITQTGVRVEFHDPQAAIDKILRVAGRYVDRKELTGPDGGPILVKEEDGLTDDQRRSKLAALRDIAAYLAATGAGDSDDGSGDDTAE